MTLLVLLVILELDQYCVHVEL